MPPIAKDRAGGWYVPNRCRQGLALACGMLATIGWPLGPGSARSEDFGMARPDAELYRRIQHSTAWVKIFKNRHEVLMGTGFLIDRGHRWLVTNYHVVDRISSPDDHVGVFFPRYEGGDAVTDRKDYQRYDRPITAWVVAYDPARDLAVLELEVVPAAAIPLKLASESLAPGDPVHLIGNPGTREPLWVYNTGMIHQVTRKTFRPQNIKRTLDGLFAEVIPRTPIRPGFSGGPMVNVRGELVGVATLVDFTMQESWAIDGSEVVDLIRTLKDYPRSAQRLLTPRTAEDRQVRESYFQRLGPIDRGIERATDVIRREPGQAAAYRSRGAAYSRQGEFARALADFDAALRLAPTDLSSHYQRGLTLVRLGQPERAIDDFSAVIRAQPGLDAVWRDRAHAAILAGKMAAALTDLDEFLKREPNHAVALLERSWLQSQRGAWREAIADAREAVKEAPSEPSFQALLALLLATCPDNTLRDGGLAVEYANRAVTASGGQSRLCLEVLAAARATCGDFARAIEQQRKAGALATNADRAEMQARLRRYEAKQPLAWTPALTRPLTLRP